MPNPSEEVVEQVRAMRAALLGMGGGHFASRASEVLDWARRDQREPTLGELLQAAAMLLIAAESKLLQGNDNG